MTREDAIKNVQNMLTVGKENLSTELRNAVERVSPIIEAESRKGNRQVQLDSSQMDGLGVYELRKKGFKVEVNGRVRPTFTVKW